MTIPYAVATGVVDVERLLPFMTDKMRTRYEQLQYVPQSAIIAAFSYNTGNDSGNIARFARVPDYHSVVYSYLCKAAEGHEGFHPVKNGWPLPLVPAANLAGVGFTGLNGLQIVEPYGSYVTLGAILSEKPLAPTAPKGECAGCRACERACPTGAMHIENGHRVLNREWCIASITQAKDSDKLHFLEKSPYIWGCDICQEVCPHNAGALLTDIPEFTSNAMPSYIPYSANRHYSGRESLVLRNLERNTNANNNANTNTIPSVSQTFSITPT